MKTGYYIKVEHLFWTGRFWRGDLVLTERATRAARFSARQVAEDALEDARKMQPKAALITHLATEKEAI